MKFSSAIIIATYNWPEALKACMVSLQNQSVLPDEIIIADDGSTGETKQVVDEFKNIFTIPLVHVWHEDDGFRLSAIRNKAVAKSNSDYIIQVDGDLILHHHFVRDHLSAARQGNFIAGSRGLVDEKLTREILAEPRREIKFDGHIRNTLNVMHMAGLSRLIGSISGSKNYKSIRGCNMSFWRKDFIAVNGYDETYVGWGREDTDLVIRFFRYGLHRTFFKFRGIVYHLHHHENDRSALEKNDAILERTKEHENYRCEKGISQYI